MFGWLKKRVGHKRHGLVELQDHDALARAERETWRGSGRIALDTGQGEALDRFERRVPGNELYGRVLKPEFRPKRPEADGIAYWR